MEKKLSEDYRQLSNLMVGAKVAIALRTVTGLGIADFGIGQCHEILTGVTFSGQKLATPKSTLILG